MGGPTAKFQRVLADYRWYVLGAAGLVAFVLGYIGLWRLYGEVRNQPFDWTDPAFGSLKLFLFNPPDATRLPWQLDVARFLAPFVAGYAGITALGLLFRDRVQQMRIPLMRNHVVVCGLGYVGNIFLQHLDEAGLRAVVIETDANNPRIELCRTRGVPVIIGDAQSRRTLRAAGVERASRLLAVSDYDAINAEIISLARELVADRSHGQLHCLARIGDPDLCAMLRIQQPGRAAQATTVDFVNVDEIGARLLLDDFPAITEREKPHILVAHLDGLGRWLIWHAARDWHYTRKSGDSGRLRVTVADDQAPQQIQSLLGHHPELRPMCEFIPTTTFVGDIRNLAALHARSGAPRFTRAYVTAFRDEVAVPTALMLRHEIDDSIPVTLALSRAHGVTRLITDAGNHRGLNIDVFPTLERACTVELIRGGSFEVMARAIHRLWRSQQLREGKPAETWAELDESRKESSRQQALDIIDKLHAISCDVAPVRDWATSGFSFTSAEIERLSIDEHDRWCKERIADGWTLGDEKDVENKRHPDLIPWDDLSEAVREYDRIFVRGIPTSLASVGLQVVRRDESGSI
ncbi:MAG TPA: RyR domain-containing protein [Mycobacterium sp.]|nr:RyR domain-containing protein [Mycobacterium sp.]